MTAWNFKGLGLWLWNLRLWLYRLIKRGGRLITTLIDALCDAVYLVQEKSEVQLRIDLLLWKATNLKEIPTDPLTSRRLQGNDKPLVSS